MRLILGDDWTVRPLGYLVAEHPELRRLSLQELIAQHEEPHQHTARSRSLHEHLHSKRQEQTPEQSAGAEWAVFIAGVQDGGFGE
jgi:hypothetical protein